MGRATRTINPTLLTGEQTRTNIYAHAPIWLPTQSWLLPPIALQMHERGKGFFGGGMRTRASTTPALPFLCTHAQLPIHSRFRSTADTDRQKSPSLQDKQAGVSCFLPPVPGNPQQQDRTCFLPADAILTLHTHRIYSRQAAIQRHTSSLGNPSHKSKI